MLKVVRGVLGPSDSDEDDALQEANLALLRALATFRSECTTAHFACQVALRSTMNLRRRRSCRARHTPLMGPGDLCRYAQDCAGAAESIGVRRCLDALRHLLIDLPLQQSEVISMRIFLGFTVTEAAEAMRLPIGTVKRRLTVALSLLRERGLHDAALLELIEGYHEPKTPEAASQ
jgi:RNA polymerase sigma-70 factor (ECF subfamily)